jgi:hypothetical protein
MTTEISQSDYSNLLPSAEENKINDSSKGISEIVMEYPQELGRGFIHEITDNSQLSIS